MQIFQAGNDNQTQNKQEKMQKILKKSNHDIKKQEPCCRRETVQSRVNFDM